jgi:hypothetical protein
MKKNGKTNRCTHHHATVRYAHCVAQNARARGTHYSMAYMEGPPPCGYCGSLVPIPVMALAPDSVAWSISLLFISENMTATHISAGQGSGVGGEWTTSHDPSTSRRGCHPLLGPFCRIFRVANHFCKSVPPPLYPYRHLPSSYGVLLFVASRRPHR